MIWGHLLCPITPYGNIASMGLNEPFLSLSVNMIYLVGHDPIFFLMPLMFSSSLVLFFVFNYWVPWLDSVRVHVVTGWHLLFLGWILFVPLISMHSKNNLVQFDVCIFTFYSQCRCPHTTKLFLNTLRSSVLLPSVL